MKLKDSLLLIFVGCLWGSSYLLIKLGLDGGMAPAAIVFGRCSLAAVVLYGLIRLQKISLTEQLAEARATPIRAFLVGLLIAALPFTLITYGELSVPSGLTAVLLGGKPFFIAIFALFLDRSERLSRGQLVGLCIGIVGVAFVAGFGVEDGTLQALGVVAILVAGASYALGGITVKHTYRTTNPVVAVWVSMVIASLLLLPLVFRTLPSNHPTFGGLAAVLGLGVINTALTFTLYYRLIGRVGAGGAGLVTLIQPVTALFGGYLLLNEELTPVALTGVLLIIGGVALASKGRRASVVQQRINQQESRSKIPR